jgi:peptidoglycan/LPS O-acetylase OafA/YrhL
LNWLADMARRLALPLRPGAFRLFLAMLVFVHHFSSFALGGYAVYVFFVLSGFWVQQMWTDRYARTRFPYATYIVSRVWRLAPVMALVSLMTVPLLLIIGVPQTQVFAADPAALLFSSVLLLGYSWLPYGPVGSAWSLDVEMQFYLLAPALAWLSASFGSRPLLVGALVCSLAFSQLAQIPVLPKYILFFSLGMVAARSRWRPSRRLAALSGGGFVALVALVLVSPWRDILIVGAHPGPLHAYNLPFNVLLALISIPFAIRTTGEASDADDRMMADLSYIVYLLHWVAMQWFFTIEGTFLRRLVVAALCFAAVPAASWLIWRFVDRPLNRLRAKWVRSRMTDRPVPPPVIAEPAGP